MEEITLVPVKDRPPGRAQPWYARYPRPAGKDPVQWMIESTANAIYEKKLTVEGIPASWAASRMDQLTAPSTDVAQKPDTLVTEAGMTFVYIKPGSFFMGSPSEEYLRDNSENFRMVTIIKGFYLQTTEVTQRQWKTVMGYNPSHFEPYGDDCPVEWVSWENVQKFITSLNNKGSGTYRLPTEAEWEYACRGGTVSRFYTGDSRKNLDRAGWYSNNADGKPHPVGQKEPNAFGLFNIHGNISEWCEDDWQDDYNNVPNDGSAWMSNPRRSFRVVRGGSYLSSSDSCRAAYRGRYMFDTHYDSVGFRLAFQPDHQK
jgi:formylglycine-generating enzyme required for sulfatase activity